MSKTHPLLDEHHALLAALGGSVRARRTERGWSLRDLARRAGLSERFVGQVENGVGNPAVTRLHDLARALDCSMADLLPGEGVATRARPAVALVGLRGAGKTSVGRLLARRLRCRFVELDAQVEHEAGLRLGEIFALHGEGYYRRMEVAALQRVLQQEPRCVIATGGGVITNREAMEVLKRHACTVWLKAPVAAHWERVSAQGDRRPMAGNPRARQELDEIYARRAPLYARADLVVETARLDVAGVVHRLADVLGAAGP
ncbi:MAG: helix-turn-helix domain-containing protein [Deltaproteobacteria bacterium]|nr:helix-turn-helix domain-containing protein [Deltaproteobacteria bacterium]